MDTCRTKWTVPERHRHDPECQPGGPRHGAKALSYRQGYGESRRGISPPRAPRSVREPLGSYGSRCSVVDIQKAQAAVREMLEEHLIRHKSGHSNDAPAG